MNPNPTLRRKSLTQKSLSMPLYSRSSSPSSSLSMQDCMAAKRRRARGMGAHWRRTGGERRGVSERERWVGPKRMTTINGLSMPPANVAWRVGSGCHSRAQFLTNDHLYFLKRKTKNVVRICKKSGIFEEPLPQKW